jgi:hypothetical protein
MDFLKTILPWIGTAVAGPLGGMAISFFAEKLGVKAETANDIQNWLKGATPGDLLLAKQADQEFQVRMKELEFHSIYDLEKLSVDDRISARDREVQTGDNTTRILAFMYSLGYFGLLVIAVFYKFPTDNQDTLNALLGMLSAAEIAIVQYYFGSSRASSEKNEALLQAIKNGK